MSDFTEDRNAGAKADGSNNTNNEPISAVKHKEIVLLTIQKAWDIKTKYKPVFLTSSFRF